MLTYLIKQKLEKELNLIRYASLAELLTLRQKYCLWQDLAKEPTTFMPLIEMMMMPCKSEDDWRYEEPAYNEQDWITILLSEMINEKLQINYVAKPKVTIGPPLHVIDILIHDWRRKGNLMFQFGYLQDAIESWT